MVPGGARRERVGRWEGGDNGRRRGWSPGLPGILMSALTFLSGAIYLSFSFLSSD